ncbi:MAG: hypothetical protein F6K28_29200 [Microcoleus sp. SIO2G3]|nr:hypothetical protein [Microcoleus sp. SIO2G3]
MAVRIDRQTISSVTRSRLGMRSPTLNHNVESARNSASFQTIYLWQDENDRSIPSLE